MGEIYSISMNKGGVGKTSLVSNIAGAIIKSKKKVLIVDTDPQGSSSEAFGYEPDDLEHTLYHVLLGEKKAKDVLIKESKNLHILPSNWEMNFLEFDILPNLDKFPEPYKLMETALKDIVDDYDYILIDTPPSMGLVQMNVLAIADQILIPVTPETFAVKGLPRILKAISDFKKRQNPSLKIAGVVFMMVDYRTALHSDHIPKLKQFCIDNDIHFYTTEIKRSIRFADAVASEGKPATMTKYKNNEIVQAYFELTKEIFN